MNVRIILSLLLVLAARPAEGGRYLSAIAVAVGSTAGGKVNPAPAPSPSGTCDNCNGTGRLGDGTVSVDCPLCVDGKVTSAAACSPAKPAEIITKRSEGQPAKSTKGVVVVKQPGPMWYQNGHSATVDHLVNVHGYDRATVMQMTARQRDIAHSNAHNAGRYGTTSQSGCPNGRCPSSTRGFRLFRR